MRTPFFLLLVACGGQTSTDPMMDASTFPDSSPVMDASVPKKDASTKPPPDTCSMNKSFGIYISAYAPPMFQGKSARLSALENNPMTMTQARRVLQSAVVDNGFFGFTCPYSLSPNSDYPSWAVFIAVDGDGHCSAADVGYQMQLFGWMMDVTDKIPSNGWVSVTTLKPPIGGMASDFCSGYFE